MYALLFATPFCAAAVGTVVTLSRATGRPTGPSWFDLLPYMRASKKALGRAQRRRR